MANETVSLRADLNSLDCGAQQLAAQVIATCKAAKLTLLSQDPEALKTVYVMLGTIEAAVLLHENDVNATAEGHGCNWIDQEEREIMSALVRHPGVRNTAAAYGDVSFASAEVPHG